jgi:hypothetical protein
MFIWADKKKRSVAIPFMTSEEVILQDKLNKDLYQISRLVGEYSMTSSCIKNWTEWYNQYDEDESGKRICVDKSFSGWYSRKPSYIIKIAMLRAAATSNILTIKWNHVEDAIEEIRKVEHLMGSAFKAMGRSEISGDVDSVMQVITSYGWVSEKQLMSIVWKDIDAKKFENVIDTLIKTGKVVREYKGPNGEKGIWYRTKEAMRSITEK